MPGFYYFYWNILQSKRILLAIIYYRTVKKLDGNYTRMLRAVLNKSWQQHPTRRQLYGHLPPITKTIQARRTRHIGHCWRSKDEIVSGVLLWTPAYGWRSKDEIVSDVLLWTPAYGQSKAGRPARTFIQQLCDDTWCNPEDLPEAMNDRETWRERFWDIRASRTTLDNENNIAYLQGVFFNSWILTFLVTDILKLHLSMENWWQFALKKTYINEKLTVTKYRWLCVQLARAVEYTDYTFT